MVVHLAQPGILDSSFTTEYLTFITNSTNKRMSRIFSIDLQDSCNSSIRGIRDEKLSGSEIAATPKPGQRECDRSAYSIEREPDMNIKALHFIGEPIQVEFDQPPLLEKKPGCPDRFVWREETYRVVELLSEWHDYGRRGRMAANMRPTHIATASRRGSWGVGRDYFRVRTGTGQIFDLYYDRAPKSVDDRKGGWFLYREMSASDGGSE